MSLSDRLSDAKNQASIVVCKLGALLHGERLTAKEKSQLQDILSVPENDPSRVSNTALAQILREEGFDISKSSIDRHKNKSCTCYRKAQ
jgi:hypothetical protein